MLRRASKAMARKFPHGRVLTYDQVVKTFRGKRLAIYTRARETLKTNPLHEGDARIQAFVKAEKTNPDAKVNPDPRMIQARGPRYNLAIARYLRYVEHLIYNLEHRGVRSVAKGMNQTQRAEAITRKFAAFYDTVCFSIDCSRWDQHVSLEILEVEHGFYQHFYPDSAELAQLLKWQRTNRCRTKNGVKYRVRGGRMSGDINTALGNCLLMVLMVRAVMDKMGVEYDLFDDGDDCLIFINGRDFEAVSQQLPALFRLFGQELKVENVARQLSDIVFCQSRIVFNGVTNVMVRDWRKVLSQACCGTKHWNEPNMVRPMLGLVAACESVLCKGVPILAPFAAAMHRLSGGCVAKVNACDSGLLRRYEIETGRTDPVYESSKITTAARVSFQETFGVDVGLQHAIERRLANWHLSTTESTTVVAELDHQWDPQYSSVAYIPELL